ncbi:MAG: TonB-dependent receptor [Parvularculaceae bacterium]|nr:TonB-dependent receptor [Parvularculaceae bacterium]
MISISFPVSHQKASWRRGNQFPARCSLILRDARRGALRRTTRNVFTLWRDIFQTTSGKIYGSALVAIHALLISAPLPALAQEPVDEIVVVADPLEFIALEGSRTVYGLDLDYDEIPRAISVIGDEAIDRFNIDSVDDLAAVSPGTFTGSFFGVPGSVTLRGNRADSYFRGFKRAENPGTFPTPIGASERIEVVRGTTPALYGAGRVGGFVNVTPLTALTQRRIGAEGSLIEIGGTLGSYGKRVANAAAGKAFDLSGKDAGLYGYVEYENSESFYRGIAPERFLFQGAATLSDDDWSLEIGGAYYASDGYKQTIGWNRVTQDLIDDGVYITGRDTDLSDLNGDGKLTPDEVDAAVGSFFGTSNIRQFIDFGVFPSPAFELDTGVGTAALDRRTVFISDQDIADASTGTAYADFSMSAGSGELRLQAFYDSLDGQLYQSYGFAADYVADVVELRASYEFPWTLGAMSFDTVVGASWRRYDNETRQTFLSGYLAVDRRDLTQGPAGGDIFDDPFSDDPNGIAWDTDLSSLTTDLAVFAVTNARLTDRLSVLASLRLDRFTASSINEGATIFNPALGFARFKGDEIKASYEASLSYEAFSGVRAYATYAQNNALETNDAGGIEVDRIDQGNFVADSQLVEAGVKAGTDTLTASLALYRQERTRADPFGNVDRETSKGVEAELRYLITDQWSANAAVTVQETRVAPPGPCGSGNGEFIVLPPSRLGIAPADGFGGLFAALNASCLPELQNGYRRRTAPTALASAFLTYTSPETPAGAFGATAGATYVGETGGKITNAIRLPAYALARASVYWERDNLRITAHADNLFDKRYFIPVQNVYEEVGALPGRGREFQISLTASF